MDPTAWAGLATLIVLELVLGIDNLVFIAILAEKLPKNKSDKARIVGLSFALIMRLFLLTIIGFVVTLTQPLFTIFDISFSGRQLIMLFGGIFLLYKATMELNERLEGKPSEQGAQRKTAKFWSVVAQIVVLDAVFSLDSVITAVGMVPHLPIMIIAVTIAMIIMIIASKPLTQFVNAHPTIIILCLSFLLMIGFSLIAEGFGYDIPKGYLYAAIGFSLMIEMFNQVANFNRNKFLSSNKSFRQRTADAVLTLIGGRSEEENDSDDKVTVINEDEDRDAFNKQERQMISRVLGLAQRSVSSIMTSRHNIDHINLDESKAEILKKLEKNQHTRFVVTNNASSDEPIGFIDVNDLLIAILSNQPLDFGQLIKQPPIFPETVSLLVALEQFKQAKTHFAFIVDEFGSVQGIVTLTDVMETIAGDLPEEGETIDPRYDITQLEDGSWIANGYMPLDDLIHYLPIPIEEKREYHTIAGLVMEHAQSIPSPHEKISIDDWIFEVLEVDSHRIVKVKITPLSLLNTPVAEEKEE